MFLLTNLIPSRGGLLFLLACFVRVELFPADVEAMPFWEDVPLEQQSLFELAEGPEELFVRIVESESQLPMLFVAATLNMLAETGLADLVPRFMLAVDDRVRAVKILESRIDLYLLQNRSHDAQRLAETLGALSPVYNSSIEAAELYLSLGQLAPARVSLGNYLQKTTEHSPTEYARNIFLLARLFLAEENKSSAEKVLRNYFEGERGNNINSLYHFQNTQLLRELLLTSQSSADNKAILEKLDRIINSNEAKMFLSAISGSSYPDSRVLAGLEDPSSFTLSVSPSDAQNTSARAVASPSVASRQANVAPSVGRPPTVVAAGSGSGRLIQLGSFGQKANAENYVKRITNLSHRAFVYAGNGNYKVFIDPQSAYYRESENLGNAPRLLVVLRELGVEGFIVPDPR